MVLASASNLPFCRLVVFHKEFATNVLLKKLPPNLQNIFIFFRKEHPFWIAPSGSNPADLSGSLPPATAAAAGAADAAGAAFCDSLKCSSKTEKNGYSWLPKENFLEKISWSAVWKVVHKSLRQKLIQTRSISRWCPWTNLAYASCKEPIVSKPLGGRETKEKRQEKWVDLSQHQVQKFQISLKWKPSNSMNMRRKRGDSNVA